MTNNSLAEVTINGITYRLKKQKERTRYKGSKLLSIAAMAMAFTPYKAYDMTQDYGHHSSPKEDFEVPHSRLIKEYELIQNKKSKLSKRQREAVIWRFEALFEPVEVIEIEKRKK